MYTLFYKPGACSMAVHVLLNELNQPFELKHFKTPDDQTNPELLALNSRGMVPTLKREDGFHMAEGGAILVWLADEHKSSLLPRSGTGRAEALQWLMFANASLHPAYGRLFWLKRQDIADGEKQKLIQAATAAIQSLWDQVEEQLQNQDYISGSQPSVADILFTVIANWVGDINFGPNSKALFTRISERPAYAKALKAEEITYKAAA